MSRLVGAEFLKLRTTRAWIGYVLALVALSGIGAAGQLGGASELDLERRGFQRDVITSSVVAGLFALLLGITCVTVEWRHGTIARTFLVTPRRERVLGAKGIAAFLVGAGLALLAILVVLAVAAVTLSIRDASLELDSDLAGGLGRVVLAAALWGVLGAGFGALVQSQTVALVSAILWILPGEALTAALLRLAGLDTAAKVLPAGALGALAGGGDTALSPALGGVIGLVYVGLVGALGYVRVERRDIG